MSGYFTVEITGVTKALVDSKDKEATSGGKLLADYNAAITLSSFDDFKGSVHMEYSATTAAVSPSYEDIYLDEAEVNNTIVIPIYGSAPFTFTVVGTHGSHMDSDSEAYS